MDTQSPADGLYVYAIASGSTTIELNCAPMREVGSLEVARVDDMAVICERMPIEPWTGPQAEENLKRIEWVAPRAVQHESVNESVGKHANVFPMSFGTLFSSMQALESHLRQSADTLHAYFERTDGRVEWAVKGLLDRKQAEHYLSERDTTEPTSGAAYLMQRKKQAETKREFEPWLNEIGEDAFERLGEVAVERAVLTGRGRRTTDDGRGVVFNWAALLADGDQQTLRDVVDQLNQELDGSGLELVISGPWPPYSFRPALEASP